MGIIFNVVEHSPDLAMNCLEVTAVHSTRDMSVGNSTRVTGFYPYREIHGMVGKEFSLVGDFPPCSISAVTRDEAVINWLEKVYTVPVGETVETHEYAIDNPCLSWEGISMVFKYESLNVWDTIISELDSVMQLHSERPQCAGNSQEMKQKCLKLLYEVILDGCEALRPLYAWLSASKNWNTLIISDYSCFVELLGALPPADLPDADVWLDNFAQIVVRNRLDDLMNAVPGLKEFLEQAAASGCGKALEILDGGIEYKRLLERENPDSLELLLLMCVVDENDKENKRLFSRYVTEEDIRVGAKFDMGSSGVVEITEVGDEYVKLAWEDGAVKVNNDYSRYYLDSNPEEITSFDYALGYKAKRYLCCELKRVNLWSQAASMVKSVCFEHRFSFSSSSADELREEALIAKSLLKLLIDRGDTELTVPYNELCSTDDWSQMIDLLDAY